MKTCNKCSRDLSLDNFSKNKNKKDGLQGTCKECLKELNARHYKTGYKKRQAEINRNHKKKTKEFITDVKRKNPCPCGEGDPNCLDFHHLHNKNEVVSKLSSYSMKTIQEEIEKCCVLCSNCHRKLHGGSEICFNIDDLSPIKYRCVV